MANERIGIEIEVLGYEQAKAKMTQLRNYVTEVGSTQARIDMSDAIKELEANLRRLQATASQAGRDIVEGIDPKGAKQRLKEANQEMKETRLALNMIKDAMKEIPTKSWGDQFKATMRSVASATKQAGSAMQTFGRTLQSITGIGGRITSGLLMGVGYRLLNTLTSGLSGALERSDTFKTYGKVIKAIMPQLSDEETARGIERLNDAVLGLPTGLDEIVNSQKMFALSTGDYAKAVDLAIASNNAFLASGASAEAKQTGERMLNTFLATGKLTAKQWMSLQRTMPSALRAVADNLGYASDEFGTFFNNLKTGKITVDDFTKSLIEVGTKGNIAKAVEPMKETFGAILANWQNAIKRLGQNVLDTLSGVLEKTTGKNIYQWLLKVKDGIDKVSQSIQNWIKANPQKIKEFFSMLTSIDWFGFLRGIAKGLETVVGWIRATVNFIGKIFGGNGMENLGKFLIVGNMVGKIITTMGGFIKGLSPLTGAITALIKHTPIAKFLKVIISPITKLFSKLGVIGKTAKTAKAGADAVGAVGKSLGGWQSVAKMGIAVGAIPAIAGAVKLLASALKDLDGLDITWLSKGGKTGLLKSLGMMATLLGSFAGIATALGALYTIPVIGWIATYSMGKGLVIINAIAGTVKNVAGMMKELATTEYPSEDKIKELKDRVADLAPLIEDLVKIINKTNKPAYKVEEDAKTAKAYAKVVSAVSSIGTQMQALAKMSITKEQIDSAKQTISDIGDALDELSDVITDVFGEKIYNTEGTIETNISGNGYVGTRFDTKAVQAMADTAQALADVFGGFEAIVNNITALNDLINGYIASGQLKEGENGLDLGQIKDRINSLANSLYEFLDGGNSPFIKLKTASKSFEMTDLSFITKGFKELGLILTELKNIQEPVKEWVGSDAFMSDGSVGTPMSRLAEQVSEFAASLQTIANSFIGLRRAGDFSANAENAKQAVESIKTLIGTLKTIKADFDAKALDGISNSISTLMTNLAQSLATAPALFVEATMFSKAVEAFKKSVDMLTGISGDGLAQIPGQLRAIGDAVSRLTTVFSGVGAKWHDAIIDGFNAPSIRDQIVFALTSIAFSISTAGFYSAGYSAGLAFASGARASVGNSGGIGGIAGALFRARGGSIFKRRGTDTVPAMLTPGEYVMQRKAVSTFGRDFMRRVNALDIKGAMASLAMRGGAHILGARGMSINNSRTVTKTNNAKVTQNIYTNNANFAYRRANRWVGAL